MLFSWAMYKILVSENHNHFMTEMYGQKLIVAETEYECEFSSSWSFTAASALRLCHSQLFQYISRLLTPYYLLNVWQQFGDDTVRHSVHCAQSSDNGGGVEGKDNSELRATSCLRGKCLQGQRTECCCNSPKKN